MTIVVGSGSSAGRQRHGVEQREVPEPTQARDHRAEQVDEHRPDHHRVDGRARQAGRQRQDDRTDAEDQERGRDDVERGADHRVQADPDALRLGARPDRQSRRASAATTTATAASAKRWASTGARRTGPTRRWTSRPEVSSSAAAPIWLAGRSAITVAISRKATPRYCSQEAAPDAELVERVADRGGNVPGRHLRDDPEREACSRPPRRTSPTSTGSSSRTASPHGEPRPNLRGGTTSRDASVPAPTSRRAASTTDAATSGDDRDRGEHEGAQGRCRSAAACARSSRTASTTGAIGCSGRSRRACARRRRRRRRPCRASWPPAACGRAATSARRPPRRPPERRRCSSAKNTDSPIPKPTSGSAATSRVQQRGAAEHDADRDASAASVAPVARGARVAPASTSDQRPASSSPRSSRVAARRAQIAPIVVRKTKHL